MQEVVLSNGGKEYPMNQHGFARDREFALVGRKEGENQKRDYFLENGAMGIAKYRIRVGSLRKKHDCFGRF